MSEQRRGFFDLNIDPTPAKFGPEDLERLKLLCPQCLGQRSRLDKYGRPEVCWVCGGTGKREALGGSSE